MEGDHRKVQVVYKGRVFEIVPIHSEGPTWLWEALVSEFDQAGQSVIDGPGMLGSETNPCAATASALEQILESIDKERSVL